jgi:hypothetical protein
VGLCCTTFFKNRTTPGPGGVCTNTGHSSLEHPMELHVKRTLLLSLTLAALAIGTSVAQTPAAPEHNHGQGQEAAAAPSCCSGHETPGATNAQHDAALRELVAKMNEQKVAMMEHASH